MTPAAAARGIRIAAVSVIAVLVLLCLAWEIWLAPLRPGGSWLALKALPLLWIAPGIVRGRLYTYRGSTMLILAYFAEGTVRAYAETGVSGSLAWLEVILSAAFFVLAIAFVRVQHASKPAMPA